MLLRKIFEVPKPSRNRPGPAASCTTRASIATCTGWRVNGEMIPQPIVSRSVSRAISAETTVDERASMPCLRHHGYASASQIVSIPASSMTRADSSISSSGSIVSCMTPIRNGGDMSAATLYHPQCRNPLARTRHARRLKASAFGGSPGAEQAVVQRKSSARDGAHGRAGGWRQSVQHGTAPLASLGASQAVITRSR